MWHFRFQELNVALSLNVGLSLLQNAPDRCKLYRVDMSNPMAVASAFYEADAEVKRLKATLGEAQTHRNLLEAAMLELIEKQQLPPSFRQGRGSIYISSQTWASPLEGDHEKVRDVLEALGMDEYLPRTVNSQSLSAYVRGFEDELGQVKIGGDDGLPDELAAVLKITQKTQVKATGNT